MIKIVFNKYYINTHTHTYTFTHIYMYFISHLCMCVYFTLKIYTKNLYFILTVSKFFFFFKQKNVNNKLCMTYVWLLRKYGQFYTTRILLDFENVITIR